MTDVEDVYGWSHYTIDYDEAGNKLSRTMIYDDGHETFTSYVNAFDFV